MLGIAIRFVSMVYPVLKESLLGKQSLFDAVKNSKIQVITLAYCMTSPFVLYYLINKTISLATANIELVKTNSELNDTVVHANEKTLLDKAASELPGTAIVPISVPKTALVKMPGHKAPAPRAPVDIPVMPATTEPVYNFNEALNRKHEYD